MIIIAFTTGEVRGGFSERCLKLLTWQGETIPNAFFTPARSPLSEWELGAYIFSCTQSQFFVLIVYSGLCGLYFSSRTDGGRKNKPAW